MIHAFSPVVKSQLNHCIITIKEMQVQISKNTCFLFIFFVPDTVHSGYWVPYKSCLLLEK